jgi:tRNA pseudouridine55 synthase
VGDGIARAIASEKMRTFQTPPVYSAIKQGGTKSYERARRGEAVDLQPRKVEVQAMEVLGARPADAELELQLDVSKGYYVRSLARDLGEALGVPSHLVGLRRTRIGPYRLQEAVGLDEPERYGEAARTLNEVVRAAMPCAVLTESGVRRALWGQAMADEDFESSPSDQVTGWLDGEGNLVAVGDRSAGRPTILRAFSRPAVVC